MVLRFWELVGASTAEAFRRLNPASLNTIVDLMAHSSAIMGEEVTTREEDDACFLVHTACPWLESTAGPVWAETAGRDATPGLPAPWLR